jgi:hypothetical protein
MKGANLGFPLVFFEIPAQIPSIYRGFGLIISCTCRALSPSFPIQRGFDFDHFPLRFWSVTALPTRSMIQHDVGMTRCRAGPRPRAREARAGSTGPMGRVLTHGQ